ncbi:MAG: arsenate reductase family protein [Campylobacterales bacterium]
MKIYGIPNCGSVKKALDFVKASGVEYEFVDFKKQKPTLSQVEGWAKAVTMDRLFNTKGTKYKSSGLDYKAMSDKERLEALAAEPTMIKRPVIEHKGKVIVGFDEEAYKKELV